MVSPNNPIQLQLVEEQSSLYYLTVLHFLIILIKYILNNSRFQGNAMKYNTL